MTLGRCTYSSVVKEHYLKSCFVVCSQILEESVIPNVIFSGVHLQLRTWSSGTRFE